MEDYQNTEANTPESKASEVLDLGEKENTNSFDNAMASLEDSIGPDKPLSKQEAMDDLASSIGHTSEFEDVAQDNSSLTEADYQRIAQDVSEVEDVYGFDFNYEFMEGPSYFSDDLREQQAQSQSTLNKAKRGMARFAGEFVLNVLETPGVVGGAIGAAFTGDIETMTKNAWVEGIEGAKEWLTENNEVYTRQYVEEGGVADKMLSSDWWATEGASAGAFMAAALVPGLGVSKLGKAMSIARGASKGGKWAQQAVKWGDRLAVKVGAAAPKQIKNAGAAASSLNQLITTTAVNTMYEAGIEARGTQLAYENELRGMLDSGEVDYDKYLELLEDSKTAGNIGFWANAAILAVPNMIMSRAMLGPRGSTLKSLHKKMKVNKEGLFQKGSTILKDAPKTWLGKAADNKIIKATGNVGKQFAKNTFREGIWEEGAQMTSEKYLSERFLHDLKEGKNSSIQEIVSDVAGTYYEVLGSTDGQVAALTGGIMGSGMSIYQRVQEGKQRRGELENTINSYNTGLSLFKAVREDLYKKDEQGNPVFVKDEQGNPTKEKELDPVKITELSESRVSSEVLIADMNKAMAKGEFEIAAVSAARLQAQSFLPFIENGEEGIAQLKEALLESPIIEDIVKELENVTVNDYVDQEIEKANTLLEADRFYDRNISTPTSYSWDKKNRSEETAEERKETDAFREHYISISKDNYVQATAVYNEAEAQVDNMLSELNEAKSRKASAEVEAKILNKGSELIKIRDKAKEKLDSFESSKSYEEGWDKYYKQVVDIRKANNVDVTTYLNDVIANIKEAKTEEEVKEVVDAAIKEGLLLSAVPKDKLPEEVFIMAESDDVLEVLGASKIIASHSYEGHSEEADVALERVIDLMKSSVSLFATTVEAAEKASEEGKLYAEKLQLIKEDISNSVAAITKAEQAIDEHYSKQRQYKKSKQSEFNKVLRSLNKAREAATKTHSGLVKEIASLRKRRLAAVEKFASYKSVLGAIIENSNKEAQGHFRKLLEISNIEALDSNVLDKLPITPEGVVKAATKKKSLLLEDLRETEKAVITASDIATINEELSEFKKLESSLNNYIDGLSKIIKRARFLVKTEDKDLFLAALNSELGNLTENLKDITSHIYALESALDTSIVENSSAIMEAEQLVTSMNELISTGTTTDTTLTSEKVIALSNAIVDKYNSLSYVENLEFQNVIAGLTEFKDKIHLANEFANHLEKIRKTNGTQKMLSYSEFVDDYNTTEPQEPQEEENNNEGLEPTFGEIVETILKSFIYKVPKDKVLVKNTEYYDLFRALYGHSPVELTRYIEAAVSALKRDANDVNALSIIYIVSRSNPRLDKILTEELQDVNTTDKAKEEAQETAKKRADESIISKAEAGKRAKPKAKPKKDDTTKEVEDIPEPTSDLTEETLKTVNNKSIRELIQKIISAQSKKIGDAAHKLSVIKFQNLLKSNGEYYTDLLEKDEYISLGNKVSWEIDGVSNTGVAEAFIQNKDGGDNILVKDDKGVYHLLPSTAISKLDTTVAEENSSNNNSHTKVADKDKFEVIGSTQNVKLTVRSDENEAMLAKGERSRKDANGELTKGYNALLNYLKEARDKSKDKVTFNIPVSHLKTRLNAELAKKEAKEEYNQDEIDNMVLALAGYDNLLEGALMTKAQLSRMTDYLPITYRVTRSDGGGAATGVILNKNESGEYYSNFEKPLRQAILDKFFASNRKIGKNGKLEGVKSKFSFIKTGVLNTAPGDVNNTVDELLGVTIDTMQLVLVRDNNKAIDHQNENIEVDDRISNKVGGIYIVVKDNNGKDFKLRLKTGKLKGRKELKVIMQLLKDVIGGNTALNEEISEESRLFLDSNMPALFDVMESISKKNKVPITYDLMLQTLLIPGSRFSQVHTTYKQGELKIGKNIWNADQFNNNMLAIEAVLGHKLLNINFPSATNNNLNMPDTTNKDYFSYIIEYKLLTTNIRANEPIFVGVTKEGYEEGINPYMSAEDIETDGEISKPSEKEVEKVKKTTKEYKPLKTSIARKLERMGIDPSVFSPKLDTFLNSASDLFSKGKEGATRIIDDFNDNPSSASEEDGDTTIKEC